MFIQQKQWEQEVKPGGNLEEGVDAKDTEGWHLLACSLWLPVAWFLIEPRTTSLQVAPTTVVVHLHWTLIKNNASQMDLKEIFSH